MLSAPAASDHNASGSRRPEKRAKLHGRCLPIHELGGARRLRVGNLTQEGEVVAVLVLAQQALIRLDLGERGHQKYPGQEPCT